MQWKFQNNLREPCSLSLKLTKNLVFDSLHLYVDKIQNKMIVIYGTAEYELNVEIHKYP